MAFHAQLPGGIVVERVGDFAQHRLGFRFDLVTREIEIDAVDLGLSRLLQLLFDLLAATRAGSSLRARMKPQPEKLPSCAG